MPDEVLHFEVKFSVTLTCLAAFSSSPTLQSFPSSPCFTDEVQSDPKDKESSAATAAKELTTKVALAYQHESLWSLLC